MPTQEHDLLDRKEVGKSIQFTRALYNFSQAELAKRASIGVTTLYKAEQGLPVREKSIRKICAALNYSYEEMCQSERPQHVKSIDQSYILHQPEERVWFEYFDRRKNVPDDNQTLIQAPEERLRLGRLGMVSLFLSVPNFVMPEGPAIIFCEIFASTDGICTSIYKDAILHILRGEVQMTIAGDTIHLREGASIGYDNRLEITIEPTKPVGPQELPPLVIWVGGNRLGKVPELDMGGKSV